MSESVATRILRIVREAGVEDLWEETGKSGFNFNPILNERIGGKAEPYPEGTYVGKRGSPGRCDCVVQWRNGRTYWIEVKFAWVYRDTKQHTKRNSLFKSYLGIVGTKEDSAVRDVQQKLGSLLTEPHPGVDAVGFLLVCFDSVSCRLSQTDLEAFEELAGVSHAPWQKSEEPCWSNPNEPTSCSIAAWYWERPAPMSTA